MVPATHSLLLIITIMVMKMIRVVMGRPIAIGTGCPGVSVPGLALSSLPRMCIHLPQLMIVCGQLQLLSLSDDLLSQEEMAGMF